MIDALFVGLAAVVNPASIGLLFIGLIVGAVIAILPGLGGVVGMSVLLPVVWGMEPHRAMVLLIGMLSIMRTADSIPAILFAVPGTSGCAPSCIDGYALAKKGEVPRAMGAAFFASLVGGLFGGLCLTAIIPIARPFITLLGSPEFFAFTMLGLTMVGTLSGPQPVKGIAMGLFGALLSSVGGATGSYTFRYTFGLPYLVDGFPLVVLALGLFAIPETIEMFVARLSGVSMPHKLGTGLMQGFKDVLRNIFLVLRCSALGAFVGFLPGLGASAGAWMAYGHVVQTSKDRSMFGKGDIRGLIGPESANNAADGGDIIPTVLFGIPGGATMAIFLFAMMILGLRPGPELLTTNLSVTFTICWTFVLGNVMATTFCILLVRPISRILVVPKSILVPSVLLFIILGAFQANQSWSDMISLFLFGILGWLMKRTGWPRPPVIVGFVLGLSAEQYSWLAIERYGFEWLLRPGVIIIGLITVVSMWYGMRLQRKGGVDEKAKY